MPWIRPGTLDLWRTDVEGAAIWKVSPYEPMLTGSLYFKAMLGAPCWTREEASYVVAALKTVGIACKKGLPTDKKLTSRGSLGDVCKKE